MSSGLLRPAPDVRPAPRTTRLSLPLSVAIHILGVLALVVIPLLASDVLPLLPLPQEAWMPAAALPEPPPAPRPSAARHISEARPDNPDAAPTVAPRGIGNTSLEPAEQQPVDAGFQPGVVEGGVEGGRGLSGLIDTPPPPPTPVAPIRLPSSIRQPVRVVDVQPTYPEAARIARVEGTVIIEAVIGPAGDVQEARVLRSKPLLDAAALAAVRQWKFTPTLLNGIPVPVVMTVTVTFTLR